MDLAPFGFATAAAIRFGRGSAMAAVPEIAAFGQRPVVVHGASDARAAWLVDGLREVGCTVLSVSTPGEPDLGLVEETVAMARAADVDAVIGLGGGAAIDHAKAVAGLVPASGEVLDHLEVVGRGLPLTEAPLPFAAIPTTAGTGAEVTRNAVIGVPDAGRKVSLRDPRLLPRLALVDPALTDNTPPGVTLASGLDAVTQVIEPYLSSRANPLTDALCRDAIPRGLSALATLMAREDVDARDAMAWVSLAGGLALANSGLGAVHGLAGVLGGRLPGAPHGAICGRLLPFVFRVNEAATGAPRSAEVRGWIAEALGGDPADAPATLAHWSTGHGLPGLGALGLTDTMIPEIAAAAAASSSMMANPVVLPPATLEAVLTDAL